MAFSFFRPDRRCFYFVRRVFMIFNRRPWAAYLIAAGSLLPLAALGQGDPGTSSGGAPSGGSSGASSSFGVPLPASGGSSGSTTGGTSTSSSTDSAPTFGTAPAESPPPAQSEGPDFEGSSFGSGASSAFGTSSGAAGGGAAEGTDAAPQAASAPTFTLPGFYGAAATTLTGGEGRLGRPRFRYNVSFSSGYDDNVLQTPTESLSIPDQEVEVVVDPGTPDTIKEVQLFRNRTEFRKRGGDFVPVVVPEPAGTRQEIVPGRPPETETVIIPGQPAQERIGSFITRGGLGVDIQFFTRRTLFTFDLGANADHYWSRPGPTQTDYNGNISLTFLHRLTPRLQTTARVNAAYLSQPDLSRINSPTALGAGNYIVANAKGDLSYRWTPRFTSVVSASYNSLFYEEKAFQGGNYAETVFGTEQRYLFSPRFTFLLEARYSSIAYEQAATRDATTTFLLLGTEFVYNRLLSGSVRAGLSTRQFVGGEGGSKSTPYVETAVAYRLARATVVAWTTRFGFEEPDSPSQERLVLRTGLNISQAFSPRMTVSGGINYLRETRSDESTNFEFNQDTFDVNLRAQYLVTRRFSLNANYSFTTVVSSTETSDYYRNRLFLGCEYTF